MKNACKVITWLATVCIILFIICICTTYGMNIEGISNKNSIYTKELDISDEFAMIKLRMIKRNKELSDIKKMEEDKFTKLFDMNVTQKNRLDKKKNIVDSALNNYKGKITRMSNCYDYGVGDKIKPLSSISRCTLRVIFDSLVDW